MATEAMEIKMNDKDNHTFKRVFKLITAISSFHSKSQNLLHQIF